MKIALVTWLDATRTDESVQPHTRVGTKRETVGWLLRRDDEGVVIAMSRDWDGTDFERGFTIPRPYVSSVRILGEW